MSATQRVHVVTPIEGPLRYFYDGRTDYRSDDGKLSSRRPRPRFRVVRRSPRRVRCIRLYRVSRPYPSVAADHLRLEPPTAGHTDQIDEYDPEAVDFHRTDLGPTRTRVDLHVTERWRVPEHPSRGETECRVNGAWVRYIPLIESCYRSGRPAEG